MSRDLAAETGGKVKLDGLGGVLASHRDMELSIFLDDGGSHKWWVPGVSHFLQG